MCYVYLLIQHLICGCTLQPCVEPRQTKFIKFENFSLPFRVELIDLCLAPQKLPALFILTSLQLWVFAKAVGLIFLPYRRTFVQSVSSAVKHIHQLSGIVLSPTQRPYLSAKDVPSSFAFYKPKFVPVIASKIFERSVAHADKASEHRLNQPAVQSPAVAAAAVVKERIHLMKKQAKSDGYVVETTLYYYPITSQNAKKAQILAFSNKYSSSESTNTVFSEAKTALQGSYADRSARVNTADVLDFEGRTWGICAGTKCSALDPDSHRPGTVEAMFNTLRSGGKINDADAKKKTIVLRMYVDQLVVEVDESSDDLGVTSGPVANSSARKSIQSRKRYHNPSLKRKASSALLSSINRAPLYSSAFRPKVAIPRPLSSLREISYVEYSFTKTTFCADANGTIQENIVLDESIMISENWLDHQGVGPADGYVAKGFTKYVFLGRYEKQSCAIMQCIPARIGQTVDARSNSQNQVDLVAEARLVAYGHYFAESFQRRATAYNVKIPAISWNLPFIGKVESPGKGLVFDTFLAAPLLLTMDPYKEVKFSGSDQAGKNDDYAGSVIDAYAHHVVVDSKGFLVLTDLQGIVAPFEASITLFDPQAHSSSGDNGFWDCGPTGIAKWLKDHECQSLCRQLRLHKETVTVHAKTMSKQDDAISKGPLRIGFPSTKHDKDA
ncbi:hypothetical protein BDN72DRAFT_884148 [Pluteus cervinus]|uniref:Uncharacterized protein n=1 Tax=Pluteus cervinus TaxID=181527 RepID=A0ACD2ZZP3_9AGAR|nr:hypothetical protein BDN72DRAFT_884148 [Pluteus cervinus]